MRIFILILTLLVLGTLAGWIYQTRPFGDEPNERENTAATDPVSREAIRVVAEDLAIPWDLAFLPDGSMLVTERAGNVVHIEQGRTHEVAGVVHTGEAGLLGIALHPEFSENHYVYLYLTTSEGEALKNNVARYVYQDEVLTFDRVIVDNIPASRFHDGGRIAFGPDGMLYITVGDAGNEPAAQDPMSLAGSILRVTDEGAVPEDNPFGNEVYSYGHRNPQGLAWDSEGRLWSTEHGRSGIRSGFDEINLITPGGNYGWPDSEGDTVAEGTIAPLRHSTGNDTWAPASAAIVGSRLFFGGLRGEALYEATLNGETVTDLTQHLSGEFGRIRTVQLGPDGYVYLTTSNRDGRGDPEASDDRIIRIDPEQL